MAVYFCMRLTSIIPLPNPSLFSAFLPGMTAQMDLWIQQIFMEHLLPARHWCRHRSKQIPDLMELII